MGNEVLIPDFILRGHQHKNVMKAPHSAFNFYAINQPINILFSVLHFIANPNFHWTVFHSSFTQGQISLKYFVSFSLCFKASQQLLCGGFSEINSGLTIYSKFCDFQFHLWVVSYVIMQSDFHRSMQMYLCESFPTHNHRDC